MPRFSGMSLGDLMKVVLVRIVVYRSAFVSLKELSSVSMSSHIFLPIHGSGLKTVINF